MNIRYPLRGSLSNTYSASTNQKGWWKETTYKIFRFLYASQSKKDKGIAGVHHSFPLLV